MFDFLLPVLLLLIRSVLIVAFNLVALYLVLKLVF